MSDMSVPDALALAERYRTAHAGAMRKPAAVQALVALADRLAGERQTTAPCAHDTLYREGDGYRCHDCGEMTEYVDPPTEGRASGESAPMTEGGWPCEECDARVEPSDIAQRGAVRRLVEPDSAHGGEKYETLCEACAALDNTPPGGVRVPAGEEFARPVPDAMASIAPDFAAMARDALAVDALAAFRAKWGPTDAKACIARSAFALLSTHEGETGGLAQQARDLLADVADLLALPPGAGPAEPEWARPCPDCGAGVGVQCVGTYLHAARESIYTTPTARPPRGRTT